MAVSEKHVSRAHEARAIRQPAANFRESKCAQGGVTILLKNRNLACYINSAADVPM